MSLKAFHLFFIVISVLLSAYFGGWCLQEYQLTEVTGTLVMGIGALVAMVGLSGYLGWFLKKSKGFSYFALAALLANQILPSTAHACAVCLGNSDSPMVIGANNGVWFLMIVIGGVLTMFAGLFIFWGIRSRNLSRQI